jgi:Outer membrane protein beta-barrel domain
MTNSKSIKNYTLILLFTLIQQTVFCQENYVKGFIISVKGDTIKGLINYKDWEKNPDKIVFKNLNSEVSKIVKPSDIQAFGVEANNYESAVVQMEISSINTNELTQSKDLVFETDTVFLETVVRGKKSLYALRNGKVRPQFYIKNNDAYELLIYKKYLADVGGQKLTKENLTYQSQVLMYLDEMNSIQSKLKSVSYSIYSLQDLFLQYYKESKTELVDTKKTEKVEVNFGVLAGVSFNNIKFSSYNSPEFTNGTFSKSTSPTAGVFLELVFPKNQKRWSIENEIIYSSFKTEGKSITDYIDENRFKAYDVKFDYAYLKLINMLRYKILLGRINIFANVGVTNGFAIKADKNIQKRTKTFVSDITETDNTFKIDSKQEQGLILGLGAKYGKSTIEIRNEIGNGMSDVTTLATTINRLSFVVSYQF